MIYLIWIFVIAAMIAFLIYGGVNYHKIENTSRRWHIW